jgi:hypothetical protein
MLVQTQRLATGFRAPLVPLSVAQVESLPPLGLLRLGQEQEQEPEPEPEPEPTVTSICRSKPVVPHRL